jgi:hypothetical protein
MEFSFDKATNVVSCWIYFGILLGAHPILHISRIRVKLAYCLDIGLGLRSRNHLDLTSAYFWDSLCPTKRQCYSELWVAIQQAR